MVYNFHHLRISEMRQFVPQKEESHLFAVHYTTYSVVPKQYSLYLKKQLENYDVKFEDQVITALSQVNLWLHLFSSG